MSVVCSLIGTKQESAVNQLKIHGILQFLFVYVIL